MQITRLLGKNNIKLEMDTVLPELLSPDGEVLDTYEPRQIREIKMSVLRELVDLLDTRGTVGSKNKLFTDIWNREKRSTTGVGNGLAIPHVRSVHVKELSLSIGVSGTGYPWDAIDGKDVHVFICIVSPPYDDRIYQKLYPEISKIFSQEYIVQKFIDAGSVQEILGIFRENY